MVGTIGESFRMDSTVISDAVNVASRLEQLTKKYHVDILISGPTYEVLGEGGQSLKLFKEAEILRGKKTPLAIYTVG